MKSLLHILHLEDDPHDAALVESVLKAEGINCEVTRLKCQDDFMAALERDGIDLIFSDYVLKGHLNRLVPAMRRAMQDVEDRAERCRLKPVQPESTTQAGKK